MSATTCTSSPTFVNVTVPVTLLLDLDSSCAAALVTSCACAKQTSAQNIVIERIVFIPQTYRCSARMKTLNREDVARFRSRRQRAGRAEKANAFEIHSPAQNRFR